MTYVSIQEYLEMAGTVQNPTYHKKFKIGYVGGDYPEAVSSALGLVRNSTVTKRVVQEWENGVLVKTTQLRHDGTVSTTS